MILIMLIFLFFPSVVILMLFTIGFLTEWQKNKAPDTISGIIPAICFSLCPAINWIMLIAIILYVARHILCKRSKNGGGDEK